MKPAHLDERTRDVVGSPPKEAREYAKEDRHPFAGIGSFSGGHPDFTTRNEWIEIQYAAGAEPLPFKIPEWLFAEIKRTIKRVASEEDITKVFYVAAHFNSLVCVLGPVIDGEFVQIEESNEDEWVPTNGWVARTMYRAPAVFIDRRREALGDLRITTKVLLAVHDLFKRAAEDHDDNKFIFTVGLWLQFGISKK